MTHVAFQPRGPRVELEADYVVVGSGAGGATVAVDLARGGASVALVEAGAWRDPEDYPHSLYGALRDMTDEWASLVVRGRALWPLLQARVMGGGTVINSAIVVRTPGDVFQEWSRDHGVGGDPMADRMWAAQDQLEEELHVSTVPAAATGRSNELARAGAVAIDAHDHEIHRNVRDCLGTGQCLQGCRAERKQSTNISYIPEVLNRGGAVLSCAPVRRVILEGRRAVGVKGRFKHPQTHKAGAEFVVRAKRAVVMAASVTHSPMLLQSSGVRNKSLGRYFRAHPGSGIFGAYDDEVRSNEGATQGWSSTRFRDEHGLKLETLGLPLELAPSRLSGGGSLLMDRLQEYPHLAMWILAVRAEAVGRITRGTFGQLNVSYTLGKRDMERFRMGAWLVSRIHFAAGARAVMPGIYGLPYKITADQVDMLKEAPLDPRCWTGMITHLFGGCVMGSDPERSVCDNRGRVHGYEGLVIGDASQIPTTLGVNPQHTIMALARLRAQELLDDES